MRRRGRFDPYMGPMPMRGGYMPMMMVRACSCSNACSVHAEMCGAHGAWGIHGAHAHAGPPHAHDDGACVRSSALSLQMCMLRCVGLLNIRCTLASLNEGLVCEHAQCEGVCMASTLRHNSRHRLRGEGPRPPGSGDDEPCTIKC